MSAVRWGVLGTARIGRTKVIAGIRKGQRCEVAAIASRDEGTARRVAAELGIARAHGSYEALLDDPDIDAVYIPLPNHLHAEWTIAAARAGKHVLCEKPLALTPADAERMVAACRDASVLLMEAFMYRLHPSWEAVRQMVATGRIGQLRAVHSWFSYFNDDPADIRNRADSGGGALYDIGCYCVNLSRMLFGGEPERVDAAITWDRATGTDVVTTGLLGFARGGLATFGCSTRSEPDQQVHIYGTTGRISIGIPFNIPPDRETQVLVTHGGDPPVAPATDVLTFPPIDQYAIQASRFADAVLDGAPLPTPPEDAIANARVIERIFEAAGGRNGKGPEAVAAPAAEDRGA